MRQALRVDGEIGRQPCEQITRLRRLLEGAETLVGDVMMIGAAGIWAVYTIGAKPLQPLMAV